MKENPQYSIVIPVYNSAAWMDELINRIGVVMEHEAPGRFEVILINDCSPDAATWLAIKQNAERHPWVRGTDLLYNVGQNRAIICGLHQARGKFVLTMDDDLQHPPEEIKKLIMAIHDDDEILCVIGQYKTKRHNIFRNAGSLCYQKIMTWTYEKSPGTQMTSFRIMRRELVEALLACRTAKPQISPLIISLTRKIKNVSVQHMTREHGQSGYTLYKLMGLTFDNVINASTAPLRFFSAIGFVCAGASLLLLTGFFLNWLTGGVRVAGYTSQILLITFFGGMVLVGLGMLGEYIARIITELTGPERFRIRETTEMQDG
jgi:polyisoprenyl-phosphate glycosyltransferase